MDIIDKIKKTTKEKGWSIAYLCEKMGVTRVFFNDIKKTGREIPPDRLKQIATILDVSIDYLLGKTDIKKSPTVIDNEEPIDEEILTIAKILQKASPEQIQIIKSFVQTLQPQDEQNE